MFKSVPCSKKLCLSLFFEQFKESSKGPIKIDVRWPIVRSQKLGVRVRSSIDEHVRVLSMFEKWCSNLLDVR